MPSEPSQSDTAIDAELRSIKSRFAPVLADAAQAIVDEAMSPASKAERRIASTEVKHILEGIDRGVCSKATVSASPTIPCACAASSRLTASISFRSRRSLR